jgi:uncharacterized protein (TIGR03437 family)
MEGVTIHFKLSNAQQAELEQLLQRQQDPASAEYRKWLTPEAYADRFGLSPLDMQRVSDWLASEGFNVKLRARGRSFISFYGAAGDVARTFRTRIHRYSLNGRLHYANTVAPAIPAELEDVIESIEGLDDFVSEPGTIEATSASGGHTLAPDDIAVIYGIRSLYNDRQIDGTGQKIVVVGQSAIDLADVRTYRSKYNLPPNDPDVVLYPTSSDPGVTSAFAEANLDLDVAGAVARNAKVIYVYGRNAFSALMYAVDQNLAPVVSASFSMGCEAQALGSASTLRSAAMRANAQGITWVNAAGDAGAAGCDTNGSLIAQNGLAVRFPSAIPEVTAVGGTQFMDSGTGWWNATNDANGSSALAYIPESAWNESALNVRIPAGGGGRSAFYPKPAWQTGAGVPDDGARDVPDISFASAGHTGYNVVSGGKPSVYFGTSGATPVFAGMLVLLNQYLVNNNAIPAPGLGNINPVLYRLAQSNPAVFHDVTSGSNAVPCAAGSPDCADGVFGYSTGIGYDLATGLGSVDISALANAWPTQAPTESLISLGISSNPVYQLASPTAEGNNWLYTLSISEQNGVATLLTGLTIDGFDYTSQISAFFGANAILPRGVLTATIGTKTLNPPVTRTFTVTGRDANGRTWTQNLSVPFLGVAPAPVIGGVSNGASFNQAFAPGMVLSVFGSNMSTKQPQAAAAVPLTFYMGGTTVSVNGVAAPVYYVSPGQINLQIPYETAPGDARITINNGLASNSFTFLVAEAAPGIFVDSNGATVPFSGGQRGGTYVLYITGEGQVTPSLATGDSPPLSGPFPSPRLPLTMTIGGVDTKVLFKGVPPFLVGVTQINFTVPDNAPLGAQPVVVSVGGVQSAPATFTVR